MYVLEVTQNKGKRKLAVWGKKYTLWTESDFKGFEWFIFSSIRKNIPSRTDSVCKRTDGVSVAENFA